ncbi:MAG: transketolase [Thermodesulfobacteriota bacterium]|nr:transketolase [Thermodesulfobacteriota bacterium]
MDNRLETIKKLEQMANRMRKTSLDMALAAGGASSHFGGGLSIIDITATLYGAIMRYDVNNPEWEERDRFILSKGHGVLGYYPALVEVGFVPLDDLVTFEKTDTYLAGHPIMNRKRGIEFTNGSLGMGLSVGIGVALAGRRRKNRYNIYVLLGDGECNEGAVWEAAMAASHFNLDNLTVIIDRNQFQLGGNNTDVMSVGDLAAKWRSFGWEAMEVDGHHVGELYDAFLHETEPGKPVAIVANTIKGKGVSFAENNNAWHHAVLTKPQYDMAISELNSSMRG